VSPNSWQNVSEDISLNTGTGRDLFLQARCPLLMPNKYQQSTDFNQYIIKNRILYKTANTKYGKWQINIG